MSQSKTMSFLEAVANTLVGLAIAYFAQSWFLSVLGVTISEAQNWALVGFMTVVSIARSYVMRRLFNRYPEPVRAPYCDKCNSADLLHAKFDEECG